MSYVIGLVLLSTLVSMVWGYAARRTGASLIGYQIVSALLMLPALAAVSLTVLNAITYRFFAFMLLGVSLLPATFGWLIGYVAGFALYRAVPQKEAPNVHPDRQEY